MGKDWRLLALAAVISVGALLEGLVAGTEFLPLLAAPVVVSALFGRPAWSGLLGLYSIAAGTLATLLAGHANAAKVVVEILVATTAASVLAKAVSVWQARVQREQRRFEAVVASAGIAMAFGPVDTAGMEQFNDALCDFFECSPAQLRGRPWQDFTHPDDLAADMEQWQRLARGEIDKYQMVKRYRLLDGRVKWGFLTVATIDADERGTPWAVEQIVDITAEVEAQEQLQREVDFDSITGLHSRSWITAKLQQALDRAAWSGGRAGVLLVDLSEYGMVSRSLGYLAGDAMLRDLGQALERALDGQHAIGRFLGHGFVVVVQDASADVLHGLAQRLIEEAETERVLGGLRFARSACVGMALSEPGGTAATLLRDADQALVQAQATGTGRARLFDSASRGDDQDPLQQEHALRVALAERQFVVHYQPQVRLSDRTVVGFEALVRWQHPERGLVAPGAFIPVMEQSGLIVELGHQVLDLVCADIADDPTLPPISLNVSAREFTAHGWLEHFRTTVERHGVTADRLVVELTETTMLQLTPDAQEALDGLRALGFALHLDDFGTGYASISVLGSVPLTALKLDRDFVHDMDADEDALELVRGIAGLAQGMRLDAIAEGVETEEQAQALLDAGWTFGQGYLFGRPGPRRG